MFDKRLLRLVPAARRLIAGDVALQWIALMANIAIFMAMGIFLQRVLEGSLTSSDLAGLCVLAAGALVERYICQKQAQRLGQKAAQTAKTTIRQAIYGKLIELGPAYRETTSTGEALQISVEGVEHLESYFGLYLPQLFYAVLAPVTLFICLAPLSLPTALTLLVCVPFIPLSIIAVQKIAKRIMGQYWGTYTDLGAMFLESIQGLSTLKVFQADAARHAKLNAEAETFRQATMRLLVMQLNSITIMDLFAFGGAAVGIIVALNQMAAGVVSFGAVFTIIFLSAEFFLPLRTLGSFFHTAMSGMAAADKMFALLDKPTPKRGSRCIDPVHVDIECVGVGYSYDGKRTVLEGVDLTIPQGSFVGITGESGSGKSTLAGILSGSLDHYTGAVYINGIELKDLSQTTLRETITYVPFASYLFEGTIRSNLLLAKPHASDDELWEALTRCKLADFVRAAGGLDAVVSPEGANLSGGQRQRLAMARALLHDTPVYLLDEATSNIDVESEAAIIALAHELAQHKTVIMITHRLAALTDADQIMVMESGRVVERGTHAELVASPDASSGAGVYQRLWTQQAELEEFVAPTKESDTFTFATASDEVAKDDTTSSLQNPDSAPKQADAHKDNVAPRKRSHVAVMFELMKLTKPLLPVMALAITLGVLGFVAAIFLTVFAVYGMLDVSGFSTGMTWIAAAIAVAVCGVVRGPLRYGEQLCNHHLAFKILALVRDRLFGVMRMLAPAKLEGRNKGNLVSMVTADVELLEVFYAHTISPALIALIVSVGMIIFIAFQSPVLAAVAALAYATLGILIPWVSSKSSGTLGRDVRDHLGAMNTFVLDSLRGLPEILQFGRAQTRSRELIDQMDELARFEDPLKKRMARSQALIGLIVLAWDVVMLAVSMALVATGTVGFAPALIATAALMSSFGPVIAVANLGINLQQTLAAGERVLELLDEEPVVKEVADGVDVHNFKGAALNKVDFSYGDERILDGIDFAIKPGSIVRVAGKSGAGKSTLLKLLMRYWDADNGQVAISGHDIKRVNTERLRTIQGAMAQETFLFEGTMRENLLIAKPYATDSELEEALEKASLAELVERLPKGIDTSLGDLGDSLSGGERQRLGLARVFLHDAPCMLLDEPTSNLDSLNEAAILKALSENRAEKTIVLVSHRLSAATIADVTYSVEQTQRAS